MDSSQVFFAKPMLQALIHDIDLENRFHAEKAFIKVLWKRLPAGFGNYAVRLLARQQLLWRKKSRDLVW